MTKHSYFLVLFVLTTNILFGQISDTTKMNRLIVYGDGFIFSIKEPDGWTGDIDKAKQYYTNIIFYKSKEDLDKGGALIHVYSFSKQDEETDKNLEYDIKGYKDIYKKLKQQDLLVTHKEYKCYSKTVYVENDFYQYTAYVNPGTKYKSGLTVSMHLFKRPATDDEIKAFKEIVASLIMRKG